MAVSKRLLAALIASAVLPAFVAPAQAAAVETIPAAKPLYLVKGFRGATFGMTSDQLLAAIKTDFGVAADKVQIQTSPTDRTKTYTVTVDTLAPGPGPAKISYTLGATSEKLFRIAVVWLLTGEPASEKRSELLTDGLVIGRYFRAENWGPEATRSGLPLGPNAVALFAGKDSAGAAVEVDARGVSYERQVNGKTVTSPAPKGPAALAVFYTADIAHPDVFQLAPGSF